MTLRTLSPADCNSRRIHYRGQGAARRAVRGSIVPDVISYDRVDRQVIPAREDTSTVRSGHNPHLSGLTLLCGCMGENHVLCLQRQ